MIICVPSRSRPARLVRLLESMRATATSCPLYVRLDDDDPCLEEYRRHVRNYVVGPRVSVAGAMHECLGAFPGEDCYGLVGDDTVIRTSGWHRRLRDVAGRWRIAYPDDGLKGESQATHPFIGGDFLRAIGFWALPGLSHLFTDTVWDFLGRRYGNLVYCPDVLIEHRHWSAGKCERDATYEKPTATKDQQCFLQWSGNYQIDPMLSMKIADCAEAEQDS